LYSGGKDGKVYSTNLSNFQSTLLFSIPKQILKLIWVPNNSIWMSTTNPSVENWKINADSPIRVAELPRRPGIIQTRILNNKYQILAKDDSNCVSLWNVLEPNKVEYFGEIDFEKKLIEINPVITIPNWFSVDASSGHLCIILEYPQCFSSEIYSNDLHFLSKTLKEKDFRINIGEFFLKYLLSRYKALKEASKICNSEEKKKNDVDEEKKTIKSLDQNTLLEKEEIEKLVFNELKFPEDLSIAVFETDYILYRCLLKEIETHFSGFTKELPPWVTECVFEGKLPVSKEEGFTFYLLPENEKEVPRLSSNSLGVKLTGDKMLRVNKITAYILSKLSSKMELPSSSSDPDFIQVLCNGEILKLDQTLLTVKTFFWKQSEEMTLKYRFHPDKKPPSSFNKN